MAKKSSKKLDKASKEMLKRTKEQANKIGKGIDGNIGKVYSSETNKDLVYYEPKKNNRWILDFPTELNIPNWVVKNIDRPSYPFNSGEMVHISLYDPINPSTTKSIVKFLENQKPFTFNLNILDPTGIVVETWEFSGCLITNVRWSDLGYDDDMPSTLLVGITYSKININE